MFINFAPVTVREGVKLKESSSFLPITYEHGHTEKSINYEITTGFATIVLAVWTSPVGMMICSSVIGFFLAAFGPTVAECACLLLGPRLFNFGYGYLMVLMGVGWLLGAPAAG